MKTPSRRKFKRHALDSTKQISVQVFRVLSDRTDEDTETISAIVVDISPNGFKLETSTSFGFQEKIVVHLPRESGETVQTPAEVRWVEPTADGKSWNAGCLVSGCLPPSYIDELANLGVLNRRNAVRHKTKQKAVGKWEMTQQEFPVRIIDVSNHGVGLLLDHEPEIGKRILVKGQNSSSMTARPVWKKKVDQGYLVGCEVVEGSPYMVIEGSLSKALQRGEEKSSRYQVLSLCGLSLFLVLLIREWFFT